MAAERVEDNSAMAHLLTVGDVAELCKVNAKTVQRAIRAGRLKASQLGARGAYRVRMEDVDAWIDGSTVPPARLTRPVDVELRPTTVQRGRLGVGRGAGRLEA